MKKDDLGRSEFLLFIPQSIKETFQVQLGLNVTTEWIFDTLSIQTSDIVVSIEMLSKTTTGVLNLSFPSKTLEGIVKNLFGENLADLKSQSVDGALELLNIIYATARKRINEKGHTFELAIPKVGFDFRKEPFNKSTDISSNLLCKCEFGSFNLQLYLEGKS